MTDTPIPIDAIAAYLASVERHLADLPDDIREDLTTGLPTHLAEVASELRPGEALEDRLGSPERYAAELRETVELEHWSVADRLRRSLGGAADRYTESAGVGPAAEFAASLKPGWWVLRGLLAAVLVLYGALAFAFGPELFFARPGLVVAAGLALALALVWFSLRLGARSAQWSTRARKAVAAGALAVAVAGAWCAFAAFGYLTSRMYFFETVLSQPGTVVEVGEDGTLQWHTGD